MNYKKMFFPVGGGYELEERLYGVCLVAKHFKINLEILKCGLKTNINLYKTISLPEDIVSKIDSVVNTKYEDENSKFELLLESVAKEVDIKISKKSTPHEANVFLSIKEGLRSTLIEQNSKFCDLVIAAAPPSGIATATFETAVIKSGKPVLMIPRIMRKFDTQSVIIGWNNSTEVSSAVTSAIGILKKAQRVHIISSREYTEDPESVQNLLDYLSQHHIDASFEIIKTTKIPGQALLNAALDGNFDLIIAGAYGHKGLKELMLGGATKYLLTNSTLPVFMAH